MNECITFKKKPPKLHKCQNSFGFQLARAAPVLLFRATGVSSTSHLNFQGGSAETQIWPGYLFFDFLEDKELQQM